MQNQEQKHPQETAQEKGELEGEKPVTGICP